MQKVDSFWRIVCTGLNRSTKLRLWSNYLPSQEPYHPHWAHATQVFSQTTMTSKTASSTLVNKSTKNPGICLWMITTEISSNTRKPISPIARQGRHKVGHRKLLLFWRILLRRVLNGFIWILLEFIRRGYRGLGLGQGFCFSMREIMLENDRQ